MQFLADHWSLWDPSQQLRVQLAAIGPHALTWRKAIGLDTRWKSFSGFALVSFLLDQATKYLARTHLEKGATERVFENLLELRLSFNSGTTFGLYSNVEHILVFLTIAGVLALGLLVWLVHKTDVADRLTPWAFGLIGGGAVGNILDRIVFGEVTDFIAFRYYRTRGPAFNVADIALCAGVLLLLFPMRRRS